VKKKKKKETDKIGKKTSIEKKKHRILKKYCDFSFNLKKKFDINIKKTLVKYE